MIILKASNFLLMFVISITLPSVYSLPLYPSSSRERDAEESMQATDIHFKSASKKAGKVDLSDSSGCVFESQAQVDVDAGQTIGVNRVNDADRSDGLVGENGRLRQRVSVLERVVNEKDRVIDELN